MGTGLCFEYVSARWMDVGDRITSTEFSSMDTDFLYGNSRGSTVERLTCRLTSQGI